MAKFYTVLGVLICAMFGYNTMQGQQMIDPFGTKGAKPEGPGVHSPHSHYYSGTHYYFHK